MGAIALAGVVLVTVAAAGIFGDLGVVAGPEGAMLLAMLGTTGGLVVAVFAALAHRIDGRASGALLSAGAAIYALGVLVARLEASGLPGPFDPEVLVWVRPSARLVSIALFAMAALAPEIIVGLRPLRALLAGIAAVPVTTVVLQIVPGAVPMVASAADALLADDGTHPAGSVLIVLVWAALVAVLLLQARRRDDAVLRWSAVLAAALAVAEALRWPDVLAAGEASGDLLRSGAMALVAVGLAGAVLSAFADQRRALLDSVESSRAANERLADVDAADHELRHEARNALSAIGMATAALRSSYDQMEPATRAELSAAVSAEIERLGRLLERVGPTELTPVRVRDVVAPQITALAAGGVEVTANVPPTLEVLADEAALTQALSNVLGNALKHAPGSPVTVRAVAEDDGVVLRCEDRGPGIPESERARIFTRGVRGRTATAHGSGLGLHVTARLLREQGGTVWVEARPGGGASFAMWLPSPNGSQPTIPERERDHGVAATTVNPNEQAVSRANHERRTSCVESTTRGKPARREW